MRRHSTLTALSLLLTFGCYSGRASLDAVADGTATSGGTEADADGSEGLAESSGGPEDWPGECGVEGLVQSKRLVRLTFNQQINTIAVLFGAGLAEELARELDIEEATARTFPPLANPREGSIVTDAQFQTGDNLARAVAQHLRDDFAELTGCSDAPTDDCARSYVLDTAARAFRRPLTVEDEAGLLGVYDAVQAEGGSTAEATQYAIYAVLLSPHFVYRTEFGDAATDAGRLTSLELASALSYFLTDAPPDEALMAAAIAGELETEAEVRAQVGRLLESPTAKRNLETAMFAYFQLGALSHVVIDPARAPSFDDGLRNSMYREAEAFIQNAMWRDSVAEFLTARETIVNERLAALYGMEFPPPGSTPDEDGFAPATMPENRAGLLTLPGFLTARSRPDQPSVVGRGLAVNAAFLCAENPPFPEELVTEIETVEEDLHDASERDKADYRMTTSPCAACHLGFDPYGLALDQYDIIGRYREVDDAGRTIDAGVTLPPNAGGAMVRNAVEMAEALSQTEAFTTCMAKNLLAFALAEGGASTRSCATESIVERFLSTDGSFASLVTEVALAEAFTHRAAGQGE